MPQRTAPRGADAARFADYAGALAQDLARIARSHGLQSLAYIFDMAKLESEKVADSGDAGESAPKLNA